MKVKIKWNDLVSTIPLVGEEIIVEAEPIEEGPKWVHKADFLFKVTGEIGLTPNKTFQELLSFIRTEVIEKIFTEIVYHCCPDTEMESEIDKIKSKWLGGSR